jgi:hypothetical protein
MLKRGSKGAHVVGPTVPDRIDMRVLRAHMASAHPDNATLERGRVSVTY